MDYNKNLVYFCIFSRKEYIELLELLLISIKISSRIDNIDFLVITTREFELEIKELSKTLDISIDIRLFELYSMRNACSARLYIFQYENINVYSKILYLDTDILVQKNLSILFDLEIDNKLYAIQDGTIDNDCHGARFFDFTMVDKTTPGINAGVLLFNNSLIIKDLFSHIIVYMEGVKEDSNMPTWFEQSFINYHAITKNLYDSQLLKKYVFLTQNSIPLSPDDNSNIVLNHFNGFLGIPYNKNQRMKYHLDYLSNSYIKSKNDSIQNIEPVRYKQYFWDSGRIIFHKDNVLITSWGRGTYNFLDTYIIKATWNKIIHIIFFNKTFTEYKSIRIGNMNINTGTIDRSLQNTIPVSSISLKPKNLVYFCAFHNKGYLDLLKVLLSCVKMFSKTESLDFLVFTSESFRSIVEGLSISLDIPIQIQTFDFTTQHEAGCARLFIFNYKDIDKYDKILYMDTDITIQNDISRIFDLATEDKLYAVKEYDINGEGHGAWFFDFTIFDKATPAINSGVLLFHNTLKMRRIFNDINIHIANLKKSGSIIPNCMDQSFIVYHLFRNSACNSNLLNNYVYLSEHNPPPNPEAPTDLTMVHFVWPIGNTAHKLNRMTEYTKKLLNNYDLLCKSSNQCSIEIILNKKYTWATSTSNGKIEFLDNDVLTTTWGNGIYKQLDQYTFNVSWKTYSHIIKMDSMYNSYIGLNLEYLEIIKGSKIVGGP